MGAKSRHNEMLQKVVLEDKDYVWLWERKDRVSFKKFINTLTSHEGLDWPGTYIPDAFCVQGYRRVVAILEIEDTSPLTTERMEILSDLAWRLDNMEWELEAVTVNARTGARAEFSHHAIMYHFDESIGLGSPAMCRCECHPVTQ